MPVLPAICIAIGVGLLVGVLNGLLVTIGRVPSIIVTLGMLTMLRGITLLMMNGTNIEGRPHSLELLATGSALGAPITLWIAALFTLLCCGGVYFTPLGRRIYAVGSNPKAAPLAGISITRIKIFVFALSGFAAGVAAVLQVPRNSLVQSNVGNGMELLVVTCVVVGGTSISGGKGTIVGSLIAVLLLGLVPMVLTYIGAPAEWRMAIQGAFILLAVLADHIVRGHKTGEPE
jgi:ribose/xylose/arabinose/galactoside ABC-type transport system permease subunit